MPDMQSLMKRRMLTTVVAVLAIGCQDSEKRESKGSPANESLLEAVPEKALAAVVIRRSAVATIFKLLGDDAEMTKELGNFLAERVGIDLTQVKGAVLFGIPQQAVAAFVRLDTPIKLKGEPAGEHAGVKLQVLASGGMLPIVAAVVDKGLLLGTRSGVVAGIDRSIGKGEAVTKSSPLGSLLDVDGPNLELLVGARFDVGMPPPVLEAVERFSIDEAFVTLNTKRQLTLRLGGSQAKLAIGKRVLVTTLKRKISKLEERKKLAKQSDNLLVGVSAITGYHQIKRLMAELEPQLEGGQLVSRFQVEPFTLAAAAIGVLAAVAIPSFIKYIRRSKTTEATEGLAKIKSGATAYFHADHYDKSARLLPKRFPVSDGKTWTPKTPCCEQPGGKCSSTAATWGEHWKDLRFSITGTHYYQYRFQSEGNDARAQYVVEARGDLDCDGTFSSYRIVGHVDKESSVVTRGPIVSSEIE